MDRLPLHCCEMYRATAEMRYFRLMKYDDQYRRACTATNAEINAIEQEIGGGQIVWERDQQPAVINAVIDRLMAAM